MKTRNILGTLLLFAALAPLLAYAGTSGPSPVPPAPAFQLSTSLLTLCKGVVNSVPIAVSDPAGSAPMTSLQLGLIASKNIYAIGNGTVNFANISTNSVSTLYMPIFVSLNTSPLISVGITVNYNYLVLYSDSETRNMSFEVESCPSPLSVQTSPVVTSGRIEKLALNLTNVGSKPLSSISLKISLPTQDAAILTSQPVQVGALVPGARTQIGDSVFIYRNASQSFPLNVSVNMYNGTSPVQLLDTIPLLAQGIINLTPSSITLSPATPTAGSIFSVSFILTDVGTAGASAVTVTPMPPNGITSYGSNSVFVGDMAIDTQTPVTVTLRSSASAHGAYQMPVMVSYLNSLRSNQNTTVNVPVTIASSAAFNISRAGSGAVTVGSSGTAVYHRSSAGLLLPIVLLIVIIALAFLYVRERRRARKQQHK